MKALAHYLLDSLGKCMPGKMPVLLQIEVGNDRDSVGDTAMKVCTPTL